MENNKYSSVETIIRHMMALKNQPKDNDEEQIDNMKRIIAKKVNEFSRKQTRTDTDEGVNMFKDIPKAVTNAARDVIAKSRANYLEQKQAQDARIAEIREAAKAHTVPKSAKEKSLAALAHPKDKITHADVMVGRGVKKEEVEQIDELVPMVAAAARVAGALAKPVARTLSSVASSPAGQSAGKEIGKAVIGKATQAVVNKINPPKQQEETDQGEYVEEQKNKLAPGSAFSKDYKPQGDKPGEKAGFTSKKISTGMVFSRKPVKEATDTPGNSTHQCAIHVKSEQFGEGKTLFSQHAQPDANGDIAWYDVMFEHGIEKRVLTTELEVLVSESHMSHKKKK